MSDPPTFHVERLTMSSATSAQKVSEGKPLHSPGTHHLRLARLRDRERQRRQLIFAAAIVGIVMLLASLLAAADYFIELSAPTRAIAWAAIMIVIAGLAATRSRWIAFESTDAVGHAERLWPSIGQRLRTSHDYQSSPETVAPADPLLLQALEAETQEQFTRQPTKPLGETWPIAVLLGLCTTAVVIWLIALVIWPQWRLATARLWFLPVHYSDVQMEPLPESMHQGDDLVLQLHVHGRPLQSARVQYRQSGQDEWNELSFQPAVAGELVNDLTAVIPDCQTDLEIQVEAGPLRTETQLVAVRLPLVLEQWKAVVKPPAYTKLPPSEGTPESILIPAGSQLQLEAKYNRQPRDVEVGLNPQATTPAETRVAESVAMVSLSTLSEPSDLQVKATASDGMTDDSSLHLQVIPDRDPKLKFTAPQENAEAIATAELRCTLEAFDDYGLKTVGIRSRLDDGPEQTLWESDSSDPTTAMANTVTLALEDLGVSYPQAISYYAYAMDNREPKQHSVRSELRFIDIRPFAREYEFAEGQCNCQGECLTLEKLIQEQREILGQTFAAVHGAAARNAAAQGMLGAGEVGAGEIGTKLAQQEEKLRASTEALTAALTQKVGPMPSLDFAVRSMLAAEQDLRAQAISDGQVEEEHALAYLIAARTNLRKILKQGNSQAKMARNVDQQQMDKLRKPERDRDQDRQQQEQPLAELREQLDKLAQQQQSFCQSAQACQQAAEAGSPKTSQASNNSPSDSPPSATREQLAQQQQESASKTREIQRALEQGSFGQLVPKRAQQAADSIQGSGDSLSESDEYTRAIEQARLAAEQLKRLSEHLGRRQDPDFADKLSAAERQAQQLSEHQEQLTKSLRESLVGNERDGVDPKEPNESSTKPATTAQRQLANETEELNDLLEQLLADSSQQSWEVQRELIDQTAASPAESAVREMNQAVTGLEQGKLQSATGHGARASAVLKRLAAGIGEVQKSLGSNHLEALTQAEQRSAALLKDLQREGSAAEQAMARAESRRFAEEIQSLARNDSDLARASRNLGSYNLLSPRSDQQDLEFAANQSPQFATPPTTLVDSLREVNAVLQRRIQEAILRGAMQQAVGAVPPEYSDMVDDYYRTLSEDIE